MKQEKAGGLKIFMRASEKYTRANRSPEKIFTTFSCALPYCHKQHDVSLPLAALRGDRSYRHSKQGASPDDRSERRQHVLWQSKVEARGAGMIAGPSQGVVAGQTIGECNARIS